MSEWQQIETAPKDGTEILVSGIQKHSKKRFSILAEWHEDWMIFDPWEDAYCIETCGLTHWMPLPEPPK